MNPVDSRGFALILNLLGLLLGIGAVDAFGSMPVANSQFVTEEGIFFYNGQGQACKITYDLAVMSDQSLSPIGLPYYPSLTDFGIVNNGLCGGSSATVPAGGFLLADGNIYYSNGGGQSCRYVNVPSWINFANLAIYPSFPSDLVTNGGICSGWDGPNQYPASHLPATNSAFVTDGGIYFNNGLGHACRITYNMAVRDHWDLSHIGLPYFPSLQQGNLTDDGICNPSGQQMAEGRFMTSDGKVYHSNGLGHACSYAFAGGIDIQQLIMYPAFPSEFVSYDGTCNSSPFADALALGMDSSGSNAAAHNNSKLLIATLASGSAPSIYFRNGVYSIESPTTNDDGVQVTISIGSNVTLAGEGTVAGVGDATHPTKLSIQGFLGTPLAVIDAPLALNTTVVQVDNDNHQGGLVIHSGDLVMLNNYPKDGVADLCTETPAPPDTPTQCQYLSDNQNALRFYRRRELLEVVRADLMSVTFKTGILNSYPTVLANGRSALSTWNNVQGYAFLTRVQPVENVTLKNIGLKQLYIASSYGRGLSIQNALADRTTLAGATCYQCDVDFRDFDAGTENQEVNFYEGSQSITVHGYYHGGTCPSDCGTIKLDQVRDAEVIGTFGGGPNGVGARHSIMVDTNYAEDLSGFSNGPVSDVTIDATYQPAGYANGPDIFLTGEPWIDTQLTNVSIVQNNVALHFSGAFSTNVMGSGTSGFRVSRSRDIVIDGGVYENVKIDGDGGTSTFASQNISLNNLTLKEVPTDPSDPAWVQIFDTNQISLAHVTVDLTSAPSQSDPNSFPIIQFKNVDGFSVDDLKVKCLAGQTGLNLWADVNVSNFNAVGGASTLPVQFPGIVPNGQTGTTNCPTP